ncbi:MAG TPA: hypothetical protein VMU50_18625 [Polyangia bacterium]|nr:hypothetical protein [Polyangia bacterium]
MRAIDGTASGAAGGALTVVVAAMREEVAALASRLTGAHRLNVGGASVSATFGRLGSAPVVVAVTGDGERNARAGLAALLASVPVGRVVAAGVAGALDPTLGPADLIFCDRVIEASADGGGSVHLADAALVGAAASVPGARRGVAVTAGRIADTVAEKSRLLALARARAGDGQSPLAAVVDLESAVFAAVAEHAGVPWLVWRAVSDTADEALPPLLNQSRDEGGGVRRGRVVRALLGNPGALRPLLALRDRMRAGADELARAVSQTLAAAPALAPGGPPARTTSRLGSTSAAATEL